MKRFSNPETLGAMVSPFQEKRNRKHKTTYSREFQAMLDGLEEEDRTEESSKNGEKKRRLSLEKVKALEKIFEEDSKLEAGQKFKIAQELRLEPRQVAIWFQNRRARWKTRLLERDYGVLKADYEALKLKFDELEKQKHGLVAEVTQLREKLGEENTKSNHPVQEATLLLESQINISEQTNSDYKNLKTANSLEIKDGFSERNCIVHLNDENDLNSHLPIQSPPPSSCSTIESSSSMFSPWMNYFQLLESRAKGYQQHQFVKLEEQSTLFCTQEELLHYFLS
ncbi:hypothetical protein Vadar_001031 [Vaccinium darrowii]|uniref:Uncharacterized protein n=1 Tax=Vaccinium darrowii TaxID=229202 RepID=A0ACB7XX45_9ERIC|nr:hypothetical protein Vadar_001031 [Vaccinium darrowii]